MLDKKKIWQQTANKNQNAARLGMPTFSSIRLESAKEKDWLDGVILRFGKGRHKALIAAFKLLDETCK